jgi:hypothetical protein
MDRLEAIWDEIGSCLESRRMQIYEEIRNYPLPIPACDAQYNHLLEQRSGVSKELRRMVEASSSCLDSNEPVALIEEFLEQSSFIDETSANAIRARIRQET